MGAMDTRNMLSNLAVNKYLHTVASRWISSTYSNYRHNRHFSLRYERGRNKIRKITICYLHGLRGMLKMLQHRERFLLHCVLYLLKDDLRNLKKLNNSMLSWLNNLFVVDSTLVIYIVLKPSKLGSWSVGRFRSLEHINTVQWFSTKWISIHLHAVIFLQTASEPDHIPYETWIRSTLLISNYHKNSK